MGGSSAQSTGGPGFAAFFSSLRYCTNEDEIKDLWCSSIVGCYQHGYKCVKICVAIAQTRIIIIRNVKAGPIHIKAKSLIAKIDASPLVHDIPSLIRISVDSNQAILEHHRSF